MTALINPTQPWQRARIECQLEVLSPLHIGDGHRDTFGHRKQGQQLSEDARKATSDISDYDTVCRDHRGRPILPASSLRGLLRAELTAIDSALAERLFGPMANGDALHMGRLTVLDATLKSTPATTTHLADYVAPPNDAANARTGAGTCVAHATSIDPITGAVKNHLLFSEEYVPAGSTFALTLELGPCADTDIDAVLALLNAFDGKHDINLGGGGSHGFGRFKIAAGSIQRKRLSSKALCDWLSKTDGAELPWDSDKPTLPSPADVGKHRKHTCTIELHFDSAFAVNDPGLIGRTSADKGPKIEFARDSQGNPRIPGRSLRGLLRHRARRILATILHTQHGLAPNAARECAEQLLSKLFGSSGSQSTIRIGEATTANSSTGPTRKQTFNAVDRFTGGVADSKLYNVNLADANVLRFELSITPRGARKQLDPWWLGLGLLVLRDAIEGDLALGWGKAKGMGAFRAAYGGALDWSAVLAQLRATHGEQKPGEWVRELHQRIGELTEQHSAKTGERV